MNGIKSAVPKHSAITFKDNNTPVSLQYDDVYFCKDDGLAETKHVFLDSNNLPQAWSDYAHIRICETGFGTGLNFLATVKLFEETARPEQKLFYTSIEKFPLKKQDIEKSLGHWKEYFGELYDLYLDHYPIAIDGFHPIMIKPNIFLVLIFEDVEKAITELDDIQDFFFLDGFAPAKNPDMWSETLFKNMARLSHNKTTFSTFTAAAFVNQGLQANGFQTQKINGYGFKRNMIVGQFKSDKTRPLDNNKKQSITICGAGLAGSCLAWLLKELGQDIVLVDKDSDLDNASSNQWGLINPRIGAERIPAFDYINGAFALFLRHAPDNLFKQIGSYHSPENEQKEKRYRKFMNDVAWPEEYVQETPQGLFFPDAGLCSPKKLRDFYLTDIKITHGTDGDVLATSYQTSYGNLPLQRIRGQISYAHAPNHNVKHSYLYSHYHAPIDKDRLVFGATFDHWTEHDEVTEEDHQRNLDALEYKGDVSIINGWAGFRCSSKDHLPIIGKLGNKYINIGHGANGMISSLAAAYIIAYEIGLIPQPFSRNVLEAVSPARYNES